MVSRVISLLVQSLLNRPPLSPLPEVLAGLSQSAGGNLADGEGHHRGHDPTHDDGGRWVISKNAY